MRVTCFQMPCYIAAVLLLFLSGERDNQAQTTRPAVTTSPTTQERPAVAELERAISNLSDPRRRIRMESAYLLLDAGETALPLLRAAYPRADRHEVRLRIRELAETIFARRYSREAGGFLGIRQRQRLHVEDLRIPEDSSWVEVVHVLRDTAAERAGLRPGDMIIRCGGKKFSADTNRMEFVEMVSGHVPETAIAFEVIRGQAPPFPLTVRLGYRPLYALAESYPQMYAKIVPAFEAWWKEP